MTNEGSGLSEVPCKYCGAKEYIWWARHCSNPDGHGAWQNAAESLPAEQEREPQKMSRPNLNVGGRKISSASEESQMTPESVHIHYKTLKFMNDALSTTHPSEQSSAYRVAKYACSLERETPVAPVGAKEQEEEAK